MTIERPPRLTPKLRNLVAPDRLSRPPVGKLTSAQVEVLSAIATGRHAFDEPVSAYRAIHALAEGAKPEVSVPVLEEVLAKADAPATDRVTAARELGRVATPGAVSALLGNVRVGDARVQQAVLVGLGQSGEPEVLRPLSRLAEPPNAAARRQLVLARALVAHRHGLDGPFLPDVRPAVRRPGNHEQLAPPTLRLQTAKATAADRQLLRGSTYGIDLADRSFLLRCGRAKWTVFLNADLGRSATAPERLFERPCIAALLGRWYPVRVAPTTQYVVLGRPTGTGVARLEVVRPDGEVVYVGIAELAGAGFAFDLSDVDRPGTAPTHLAGRVTSRGVELDEAVAYASRVGTRSALPVSTG